MTKHHFDAIIQRSTYNDVDVLIRGVLKLRQALKGARANTVLLQEVAPQTYVEQGYAIEDIDAALAGVGGAMTTREL